MKYIKLIKNDHSNKKSPQRNDTKTRKVTKNPPTNLCFSFQEAWLHRVHRDRAHHHEVLRHVQPQEMLARNEKA